MAKSPEEILSAHLGLDYTRMEDASDKIVALAASLHVTRKEMASICLAIGANHMIATGVPRERAGMVMVGMYDYRARTGIHTKLLVPEGGESDSDASTQKAGAGGPGPPLGTEGS